MKRAPTSLFGQLALALFGVMLVVQLAGVWLLIEDRGRLNYKLLAEYAAQRMAGIALVLDKEEPADRPHLAEALSVLPTTLSLALPWMSAQADHSAAAEQFADEARRALPYPLPIQVLALERTDPALSDVHPPPVAQRERSTPGARSKLFARTYVAQVRLRDGSVVTFHHLLPMPAVDLPIRLIALLLLTALSTMLASLWAVRRLLRPLLRFSHAAAGLAQNLDQPPLPEQGPEEVCQAARSFNSMQRDIRRLVHTRAQALSAVSHDLRLPITRLRLRLEEGVEPGLRARMDKDLDEMDAMIGHTLDFLRAGSDAEASVPLSLDALLDGVVEDMEELGAHIQRSGQAGAPLRARPQALRRCMANLLDNARNYGGGEIRLHVADHGKTVEILVSDNGPGIPAELLDKVLEPYFRVEASRARHTGGSGLGLPIARAIAEAHGGSLSLESPPGAGLHARLILPR